MENIENTNNTNNEEWYKNIKINDFNNEFALIKYADFNIILDKDTGYINATKLCPKEKPFRHWLQNTDSEFKIKFEEGRINQGFSFEGKSEKFIEKLLRNDVGGIPPASIHRKKILYELKKNCPKPGTYVHKRLMLSIGMWVSYEWGSTCADIIENYFTFNDKELINNYYNEKMAAQNTIENLKTELKLKDKILIEREEELSEAEGELRSKELLLLNEKRKREELDEKVAQKDSIISTKTHTINKLEERHTPLATHPNKEEYLRVSMVPYVDEENKTEVGTVVRLQARQKTNLEKHSEGIIWQKLTTNSINIKNRVVLRLKNKYGGKFKKNNTIFVTKSILPVNDVCRILEEEHRRVQIDRIGYFKNNII
jgi:hypothetical protein